MNELLRSKVDEIRKNLVISVTKQTISSTEQNDNNAMFDAILLSWFEDVDTINDVINKYASFKRLSENKKVMRLFNIVLSLSEDKEKNESLVREAIDIYYSIKADNEIANLSDESGYSIPEIFAKEESYLDFSLQNNVKIFYKFEEELDKISNSLQKKELK